MRKNSFLDLPSWLMGRRPAQSTLKQAAADSKLDDALKHLTEATLANKKVCTEVQRSQSSGSLKLVTLPPPPLWISPAE